MKKMADRERDTVSMETSNSSAGQALGPNSATDTAIFGQIRGCDPGTDADSYMPVPKKSGSHNESGVETAEEAVEPAEPDINELCRDMFDKMAVFLQGELTATCEDYKLVENMNKLTSLKYMEMKDISINISRNLKDLNQKYADLQPYLDQISQIEEQVTALEQAAYKLDTYSKKLEAKFKKLEKR
ncbi:biogenesis of lysosome-related organelles complex 1 subunit 2-like isoform X2 [Polyodon spathula]|uniref:biogenesis of lysosome-related organelles complex 1 subunit 2-like isoform X2 n=1 Tax=Polyodon spathula TaxID=7913 RepID=UPI001B7DE02F|nr:biogenesis of lysosome-related organelles complex 1 subunit 2-like isoform X2 [Polyodon spathula]